jgi:hypothetical protein
MRTILTICEGINAQIILENFFKFPERVEGNFIATIKKTRIFFSIREACVENQWQDQIIIKNAGSVRTSSQFGADVYAMAIAPKYFEGLRQIKLN